MAQAYYTLDEAAQMLHVNADELKQMARKGQIRSFQDRGTWRFRVQDIQELARQRGAGSEPELILGQPPAAPPSPAPSGPRSPTSKSREAEVFDFSLDLDEEHVGIGNEDLRGGPPSGKKKSGLSPAPKAGSDSDVRLITDNDLQALAKKKGSDSEVKLVHQDAPSSRSRPAPKSSKTNMGAPSTGGPRSGKIGPSLSSKVNLPPRSSQPGSQRRSAGQGGDPVDSGVRLVPLDSDSDVKIVGSSGDDIAIGHQGPLSATDSDIRLQQSGKIPLTDSGEGMLTEEIDLDEELQHGAGATQQPASKLKPKPPSNPQFSKTSPFELSKPQAKPPHAPAHVPSPGARGDPMSDSSGDFELTPAGESSSPLDTSSSDEFNLELPDDDVGLGELPPTDKADPASGISLLNPADGGISLEEKSSDEVDFELSLDEVQNTPKPMSSVSHKDSEFELSLDADSKAGVSSDNSEFELTLDDTGGLAPLEDEAGGAGDDKDIFETDFEVPALEDESGSQALALDEGAEGELESSDFDLTLGNEEDVAAEEESGSQVVALDEEGGLGEAGEEEPAFDQFETEGGEEALDEEPAVYEKAVPTAPWGALPVVFMLPCVIVLFLVGIMGFELVQSMVGHKPPGMVTKAVGGMLGQSLKQ